MTPAVAADTRPLLWLVDKPAGPTSHDVVARVRRALPRRTKVGHTGTLDPFATGLMIVLSGRATRLAPLLSGLDKRYLAVVRTGFTSATGDPEGPIAPAGPPAGATAVAEALPALRGTIVQRVPAYSAVKVGGERLYARARRGEDVPAPSREVTVHGLDVARDLGDGRVELAVHCSAGTYVRQIAADLGEILGCGAYCEALRRTHVGAMSVADARSPDEVVAGGGRDPLDALGHLARVDVDDAGVREVAHGRPVPGAGAGRVLVVHDGALVAVGEADGAGSVRPRVVLAPAGEGG